MSASGQAMASLQRRPSTQAVVLFGGKAIRHAGNVVRDRSLSVMAGMEGLGHFGGRVHIGQEQISDDFFGVIGRLQDPWVAV